MSEEPTTGTHIPVMVREVMQYLAPRPVCTIVDATVGAGGHARVLAEKVCPGGRVIGIDQDAAMLELAERKLRDLPITLVHASFSQLSETLHDLQIEQVDGVLADLGFCSDQMDDISRGLSFQQDGPLDMRMNREDATTAKHLLRYKPEKELARIFRDYGEERFAKRIARKVVAQRKSRPLQTTFELAELVRRCIPRKPGRPPRIDPATRVFQALRVAVNDELAALVHLLEQLHEVLRPGGRAVVISFHSLEDRLVKVAFRDTKRWQRLTRKPVGPQPDEIEQNPRARSAKLRAAIKLPNNGNGLNNLKDEVT